MAEVGLLFPKTEKGDRSSTVAGKMVFAAAAGAVDSQAADRVNAERNWRYGYNKHVLEQVRLAAKSPTAAVSIAAAGLECLHNKFEFVRDGQTMSLAEAMANPGAKFETGFIQGTGKRQPNATLEVPYKDRVLRGEELKAQIDRWVRRGTIEPQCGEALKKVVDNPSWLDLSNRYFVLLGAGSAMGPLLVLLELGANVIAVDLDRSNIWERLIGLARKSCGTLTFPLKVAQSTLSNDTDLFKNAGSNLTSQTPEILDWLKTVHPDKDLVVGGYAYLDGEMHVRVSLASDAIMQGLCKARPSTMLAFLNTPTQAFIITREANAAARQNHAALTLVNLVLMPLRLIGSKRFVVKNALPPVKTDRGDESYVVDGLVVAQGPNYALAKCLQHWRAVVAVSQGLRVSSNIAPSTATAWVVHTRQFAWAYGGFHHFKPMEIFQQETSNAVMAALLLNDVNSEKRKFDNPWELFQVAPFHGGVWRGAYKMTSIGEVSAALYFFDKIKLLLLLLIVAAVAFYFF
eukprot:TRINITY_DN832_c0_g1_i1.p1 TRINITY_DN832_c0_g1~~TRINITY_DN832_c0_g1_i1.p1  ORF type:complete len:530 (-),score=132.65 TRINITY_DN832_c0_g1_i1:363-1910(-)